MCSLDTSAGSDLDRLELLKPKEVLIKKMNGLHVLQNTKICE